jgi:protein translocase SecG subunit
MVVENTQISGEIWKRGRGARVAPRILLVRGTWRLRCVKVAFAVAQDVLGVLVMLGVLLQTPKATGLGGTIGGGGDSGGGYRRRRGLEASLLRVTIIFILLFVAVSIIETYVGAH